MATDEKRSLGGDVVSSFNADFARTWERKVPRDAAQGELEVTSESAAALLKKALVKRLLGEVKASLANEQVGKPEIALAVERAKEMLDQVYSDAENLPTKDTSAYIDFVARIKQAVAEQDLSLGEHPEQLIADLELGSYAAFPKLGKYLIPWNAEQNAVIQRQLSSIESRMFQARSRMRPLRMIGFNEVLTQNLQGRLHTFHRQLGYEYGWSFGEDIIFPIDDEALFKIVNEAVPLPTDLTAKKWQAMLKLAREQINQAISQELRRQFDQHIEGLQRKDEIISGFVEEGLDVFSSAADIETFTNQLTTDSEDYFNSLVQMKSILDQSGMLDLIGEGNPRTLEAVFEMVEMLPDEGQTIDFAQAITTYLASVGEPGGLVDMDKLRNCNNWLEGQIEGFSGRNAVKRDFYIKLVKELANDNDIFDYLAEAGRYDYGDSKTFFDRVAYLGNSIRRIDTVPTYVSTETLHQQVRSLNETSVVLFSRRIEQLKLEVSSLIGSSNHYEGVTAFMIAATDQDEPASYLENLLNNLDLWQGDTVIDALKNLKGFFGDMEEFRPEARSYFEKRQETYTALEKTFERKFGDASEIDHLDEIEDRLLARGELRSLQHQAEALNQQINNSESGQLLALAKNDDVKHQRWHVAKQIGAKEKYVTGQLQDSITQLKKDIGAVQRESRSEDGRLSPGQLRRLTILRIELQLLEDGQRIADPNQVLGEIEEHLNQELATLPADSSVDDAIKALEKKGITLTNPDDTHKRITLADLVKQRQAEMEASEVAQTRNEELVTGIEAELASLQQEQHQLLLKVNQLKTIGEPEALQQGIAIQRAEVNSLLGKLQTPPENVQWGGLKVMKPRDLYSDLITSIPQRAHQDQSIADQFNTTRHQIEVLTDQLDSIEQTRQKLFDNLAAATTFSELAAALRGNDKVVSEIAGRNAHSLFGVVSGAEKGVKHVGLFWLNNTKRRFLFPALETAVDRLATQVAEEHRQRATEVLESIATKDYGELQQLLADLDMVAWVPIEGTQTTGSDLRMLIYNTYRSDFVFNPNQDIREELKEKYQIPEAYGILDKVVPFFENHFVIQRLKDIESGNFKGLGGRNGLLELLEHRIGRRFGVGRKTAVDIVQSIKKVQAEWDELGKVSRRGLGAFGFKRTKTPQELSTTLESFAITNDYRIRDRAVEALLAEAEVDKAAVSNEAPPGYTRYRLTNVNTIGRRAGLNVVLDNGYVSGNHARIFRQNGTFIIEDLGSTNGTRLNGHQLNPNANYRLHDADEIFFGIPPDKGNRAIVSIQGEDATLDVQF